MSVWNRFGFGTTKPLGSKPLEMGKKRQKAILSAPNSISWKLDWSQLEI